MDRKQVQKWMRRVEHKIVRLQWTNRKFRIFHDAGAKAFGQRTGLKNAQKKMKANSLDSLTESYASSWSLESATEKKKRRWRMVWNMHDKQSADRDSWLTN